MVAPGALDDATAVPGGGGVVVSDVGVGGDVGSHPCPGPFGRAVASMLGFVNPDFVTGSRFSPDPQGLRAGSVATLLAWLLVWLLTLLLAWLRACWLGVDLVSGDRGSSVTWGGLLCPC